MRIWIDLANSPHVPFFRALIPRFKDLGHEFEITARDFAETVPLLRAAGLSAQIVGCHGGKSLPGKVSNLASRAWDLRSWARGRGFDLAVSHNSYSQIVAAKLLGLRMITLMDYEYQPANHLAFRLSSRVVLPRSFPEHQVRRFGGRPEKVRRFTGTKEDVYLADFRPDPNFSDSLCRLGVDSDNVLIVMRPPAHEALYHRFENRLFDQAVERLQKRPGTQLLLLPRNLAQHEFYTRHTNDRLLMPPEVLDGPNLIAASDFVISAGGTMNREAAALGVPAASIYAGRWPAVDDVLMREGRLTRITSLADLERLPLQKKAPRNPRRALAVRDEVVKLILA